MVNKIFDKIASRTRIGFIIAFILLLISFVFTFTSSQRVIRQANRINNTNNINHELDYIFGWALKGESAYKHYLISGDLSLIDAYRASKTATDSAFDKLMRLTAKSPGQNSNLDTLKVLLNRQSISVDSILTIYDHNHKQTLSMQHLVNQESALMQRIETWINKIQENEKGLWIDRAEEVSAYSFVIKILVVISLLIAILLTVYSIVIYNKEYAAKREEAAKNEALRIQLENRVTQLAELNKELIDLRSLEKYAVTGRIARTIAHEVRNPLTNINLSIEQLKSETPESDISDMLFKMVMRNSDRINNLVSDLLNTTRVADLSFESITINSLLDESLALAHDRLELKEIKVIKNYDLKICKVKLDVNKVKVAFLNIIVNAVEAMEKRGTIQISTANINGKCVTRISDNGKGMSKAQMDRLFEPYFSTKEKGNGLGLANAQNIILSHNGTITAESQVGKGTDFIITFDFE